MHIKSFYIYTVSLFLVFLLVGCTSSPDNEIDDPITIHSIIKEDTTAGIDIISIGGRNPMEVRKRIAESEIPNVTFEEKRKMFYSILDTLFDLKTSSHQSVYNTIDSLNYLAVHYLKDILTDKKSISNPLKHKMLKRISSYDKVINVYSWEENIGVSIQTNICVFQFLGEDGKPYAVFNVDNDNDEDFNFSRSRIISLYKLSSQSGNPLYLANFAGNYGKKNNFKGSTVLEIRGNELFFDYDGFGGDTKYFFMNYTDGENLTTTFSYNQQELKYTFKSLDILVDTRFIFNGQIFERQID